MNQSSTLAEQVLQLLAGEKPLSALSHIVECELTSGTEAQLLLEALERFLLREWDETEGLRNSASKSVLTKAILKACQFAAHHPHDFRWASQLAKVLSIDSCGYVGQAVLVELATRWSEQVSVSSSPLPRSKDASPDQFVEFFRRYVQRIKPENNRPNIQSAEIRLKIQPVEIEQQLLTTGRQNLYESVWTHLQAPGFDVSKRRDAYLILLKAGVDLAMPTKDDPQDLRLIGIAVEVLADNHDISGAFELAFQALALSTYSQHKIAVRYAWGILSEAFLRARKYVDALICWMCAASIEETVLSDIALRECITLIHLFLNLDLWEPADALLNIARARFHLTGLSGALPHYLLHVEAKVMLVQALNKGVAADLLANRLESLLEPVSEMIRTRNYRGVLGGVATVFAAVICRCEQYKTPVPEKIQAKFEEILRSAGEANACRYRALAASTISVRQVLELGANFTVNARSELGTDSWLLGILGPRALTRSAEDANGLDALGSLELMAGHRVRFLQPKSKSSDGLILTHLSSGRPNDSAFDEWINDLGLFVRQFSESGYQVEAIGLDSEDRLVRVMVHNGVVSGPIVESRDVFDSSALALWSREGFKRLRSLDRFSPHGYDEIRRVVSRLGLSSSVKGPATILLQSGRVSTVPANLLVREGGFAGESPIAIVPSLSWLKHVTSVPRRTTGKVAAWIARPDAEAAISALRIVDGYLRNWFLSVPIESRWRGYQDESPDLVVVGAHGVVGEEGQFFRMFKDEQDHSLPLSQLTKLLGRSGVVVLLVCSAGKVGTSPYLNSSVSLPTMLLDEGCRSVVASPWSLDSSKAGRWLEFFIEAWSAGFALVESVCFANDEMRRQSSHPLDWLAMHVFGDPLVKVAP